MNPESCPSQEDKTKQSIKHTIDYKEIAQEAGIDIENMPKKEMQKKLYEKIREEVKKPKE